MNHHIAFPKNARAVALAILAWLCFIAAGVLLSAVPAPAAQGSPCGPRADVIKALADKWHEATAATGLTTDGTLLEVLTSKDGATFTIIVTRPNGYSCAVIAGADWQDIVKPITGREM